MIEINIESGIQYFFSQNSLCCIMVPQMTAQYAKSKSTNEIKKYKPNQILNFFQYDFLFFSCVEELRDIYLM